MEEISRIRLAEINTLHNEIEKDLRSCLDKALRVRNLLYEVKGELKHGEFIPWMKSNLDFSVRTAQRYIKLFENRDKIKKVRSINEAYATIDESKSDTVSYLSDSVMKLGALLDIAKEGETVTGVNIISRIDKIEPPHWITVLKCENDTALYEMAFTDAPESTCFVYSAEPIEIGNCLLFFEHHPKFSIENSKWVYPGVVFRSKLFMK